MKKKLFIAGLSLAGLVAAGAYLAKNITIIKIEKSKDGSDKCQDCPNKDGVCETCPNNETCQDCLDRDEICETCFITNAQPEA